MNYSTFIKRKSIGRPLYGFDPVWLPDFLFPFQRILVEWAVKGGRVAIFADCGLGKTPMQLSWAENVMRKTNKNVLILAPLAVSSQTIREGQKFDIEVHNARDGKVRKGINVVNYERLHYFNPDDFVGIVCDESSILKSFEGKTRRAITQFMAGIQYRLLCTATPSPNDHMELGTSSEALGVMTRNSMLGMFFVNDGDTTQQWRLKPHAKKRFWQWCSTWARAVRKPSDLGFKDGKFILPPLNVEEHALPTGKMNGFFPWEAKTLEEQRHEKRSTIESRCGKVVEVLPRNKPCLAWCQLNDEGDMLERMIPGAVQVKGSDRDEVKEERLEAFALGQIYALITKPKIASFGLNLQVCADVSYFPSWSHEQFYQALRRCWRFGQENPVTCYLIFSEAERPVVAGMLRKEKQAIEMFEGVCQNMNFKPHPENQEKSQVNLTLPSWL